jgi:glycosyltransferase involved in cell wall biosynthesis
MRRAPKVTEVLPILYLRGLSTGDFQQALPVSLGEDAAGLSPTTITRLTAGWEAEYHTWRRQDLHEVDYVYVWVDGVHFRVRLEEDRLCTLVMIGVRADGTKELIAVEDGYRESTDSWATVLRDLKRRGLRAPAVAVGDSALGFWAAVGAVWPETREQRCWVHRLANVLDTLPKRLQPKAREQKGIDVLLAAFPRIVEAVPGARLAVVGDGPMRQSLEALAQRLGIDRQVVFTGWVDRASRLMPACDVVVIPSRFEGFGLVALEARWWPGAPWWRRGSMRCAR